MSYAPVGGLIYLSKLSFYEWPKTADGEFFILDDFFQTY